MNHMMNSSSTCKMDEYQCESGIPKSFQCDGRFDCQDKSDEIGCSKPTIVQNPSRTIITVEGETVTLTCRAIGLPIPLINWRKNDNEPIPDSPKITTISNGGIGTLTLTDVMFNDQGRYRCEAINSKHSELANDETILIVKPINLLCQPPLFNDLANDQSECLQCYCFGQTDTCYSSSIQQESITLNDQMKLTVTAIGRIWTGDYVDVSDRCPPNQHAIQLDPITREHTIDSTIASIVFISIGGYRKPFRGNHLLSYGGHLHYLVRYRQPFTPSPLDDLPDVIIRNGNRTMYHYRKYSHSINSKNNNIDDDDNDDDNHRRSVRFWIGEWQSNEPTITNDQNSSFIVGDLNRQQILQIISNIDDILIKASYDSIILESSIMDIELESGRITDSHLNRKRSAFVEQCSCPQGYSGTSCEKLNNQPEMEIQCDCNGNSNECDPYTGQCLNCKNHTQGFYCEQCERGYYYHHPLPLSSSSTFTTTTTITGYNDDINHHHHHCIKCPCGSNNVDHHNHQLNDNIVDDLEWTEFPSTWLLIPCHYDSRRQNVVCDACPIGYEGEHCDKCERGYVKKINDTTGEQFCSLKVDCPGNQFQCSNGTCIDKSYRCNSMIDCHPDGNDEFGCEPLIACHPVGSVHPNMTTTSTRLNIDDIDNSNGQFQQEFSHHQQQHRQHCQCKKLVTGILCDKCQDGSFYLNDYSHTGCIECFCFGITNVCNGATNLYRNHIAANIDRYSHGFILRDRDLNKMATQQQSSSESLTFDHLNREIIFQNFSQTSAHLYWQLPFNFLGNRITSYGGYLNYTFRFQGNYFQRGHDGHRKPFAIIMGNNQSLEYYHQQPLHPLIATTISIALFENQWHRSDDGQPASRRDLMIILANLDSILLLATVTNDISWIGLIAITLDTSVELHMMTTTATDMALSSWSPPSMSKVNTIEICRCSQEYSGTSCERCAPGFKMHLMTNQDGIYDDDTNSQFHRCVPCFCNGHSIDCDPLTGHCMDCKHHTTGLYCDKCESGYDGNATYGTSDDCRPTIIGSGNHYYQHQHHGDANSRSLSIVDDTDCQCNRNGTKNSECQPSSSSSSAQQR
ncbi:Basement membrane-specific heparan sulfate proteoglycan core protein, variant 2 [Dermatophagoides farinae]|uniref:Basement membrane-specific heparan sulfate proteoglycan core protein, variant 2 n=1 Tax=Dermatophagoides farinae TaxID=6954 RepID=A0A922L448_DERFA|nr:Basement membrane-specific heparan sulfate proteoglycan core protein, variant 2 [Dermatophagoides farinae]